MSVNRIAGSLGCQVPNFSTKTARQFTLMTSSDCWSKRELEEEMEKEKEKPEN